MSGRRAPNDGLRTPSLTQMENLVRDQGNERRNDDGAARREERG